MGNGNEDRGLIFFQLFPIGLGIAYGVFGKGLVLGAMWWLEALAAAAVLALAHVLVRSYHFVRYARSSLARGGAPRVAIFILLSFALNSALIIAPALLALLIRSILT